MFFTNISQIGILIPIKPPLKDFESEALECLNEIIGVANILGIDGLKATEESLHTFVLTKDLKTIVGQSTSGKPSLQRYLLEKTEHGPVGFYDLDSSVPFRMVKKSTFVDLMEKTEKIVKNRELKSYVELCLDAKTHLLKEQFKTSFLLSWIAVEKNIDSVWTEYLSSQNISSKRFKKLTESMLWTADAKLEALNLLGQISNDRYSQIIRLKRVRNKIVHDERTVVLKEAQECNALVINIIREIIRAKCFIELPSY